MMAWNRTRTLIAGLVIIAATNAVALLGVAYNRAGEPASRVELSERELALPPQWGMARESSAIFLKLKWRVACERTESHPLHYYRYCAAPWLDRAKLTALGFDVTREPDTLEGRRHYDRLLSKEVFLVLEHNGAAYQSALAQTRDRTAKEQALAARNPGNRELAERAKRAREELEEEEKENSRLFAIDAGRDAAGLRAKYSDASRYIVAGGRIAPQSVSEAGRARVEGRIEEISIDALYIPHALRDLFVPLLDRPYGNEKSRGSRYTVTVAYGARAEPWLVSAAPTRSETDAQR